MSEVPASFRVSLNGCVIELSGSEGFLQRYMESFEQIIDMYRRVVELQITEGKCDSVWELLATTNGIKDLSDQMKEMKDTNELIKTLVEERGMIYSSLMQMLTKYKETTQKVMVVTALPG